MKKSSILSFFILLFALATNAQDKSDVAIALFQKADDAYNIADYETALSALKQAEQTLGSTNTKILYLKIKTLDMLAKVDGKSAKDLELSLATFFKLADRSTYPQDKYSEILLISVNIKQRAKEEEDAYNRLKNADNISLYDNFFSQYPNSKYKDVLDGKYKELQAKQKAEMQAKFTQQWKDENLPLIKKNKGKGIGLLTSGLVGIIGGGAMMGYGWEKYIYNAGQYNYNYGYQYGGPTEEYESGRTNGLIIGSIGTGLTVVGLILAPLSSKYFKKAKRIKRSAKENNIQLSLIQQGNSVGFAMKF